MKLDGHVKRKLRWLVDVEPEGVPVLRWIEGEPTMRFLIKHGLATKVERTQVVEYYIATDKGRAVRQWLISETGQ